MIENSLCEIKKSRGCPNSIEEQHKKAIQDLYNEFKKCFETRNFERMGKIKDAIVSIKPDSPILNLIYGQEALLNGNGEISYNYLFKYVKCGINIDTYGLFTIALWNKIAGNRLLALRQLTDCMNDTCDNKTLANLILHSTDIKKRLGFLSTSLDYYQRLLQCPEGYKMILYIKLQTIHIAILKGDYDIAQKDINRYMYINQNRYIRRLNAYLQYQTDSCKDLARSRNNKLPDAYIMYLMGRKSMDKRDYENVAYFYDEAMKLGEQNSYICNSYGNYYYITGRIEEAVKFYNMAINYNPECAPAIKNLSHFIKIHDKNGNFSYLINDMDRDSFTPVEEDPDIESMGFFNIQELLGMVSFEIPKSFLKKHFDLKPY